MSRQVAFLRAINAGGHSVKMDLLHKQFEELGFTDVGSFLASGNMLFASRRVSSIALEQRIETRLEAALGFAVPAFLRSVDELSSMLESLPFSPAELGTAAALNVGLLKQPPEASAIKRLLALQSKQDILAVFGSASRWLGSGKQSESLLTNAALEKALGGPTTLRSIITLQRLRETLVATARPV